MGSIEELERKLLVGIGALTAATGTTQVLGSGLALRLLGADDTAGGRHFLGTVGMFMVCTGSVLVVRRRDPAVLLMTAGQKAGAAAAVSIGVRRRVMSPLALGVAGFDALSGLLALDAWRRSR
jgi:hypothetical protein